MRKFFLYCSLAILFISCSPNPQPPEGDILAKINNYMITQQEFNEKYANSIYSRQDTPESRREFLENLINKKLILQDAQSKDIDKTDAFLKRIEEFWEQSLLKEALDKKVKELSNTASISSEDAQTAFNALKEAGSVSGTFGENESQIRWYLLKQREENSMNNWVEDLRKNAQITINESLIQ